MKISSPNLELLLYSRSELEKPGNQKNFIFLSHFLFVERELFKHKHKRKKFLILSLIKKRNFLN